METVRHLTDEFRSCADDGGIALTSVTGDHLYLRMRGQPVCYLLAVTGIKDGKGLTRIMIYDDAHVLVSFPFGEVVQSYEAAGAHLRVNPAHQTQYPDTRGCADLDMLHSQCLRSLACGLFQCFMTDTVLNLVCMTSIGMRHLQRLGENLPLAVGTGTCEMTCLKNQHRMMTKPLRTLNLTQSVAVHTRSPLPTARTY